ncbi:minor tail protein [Mycobacterium phage Typha]|uniref:Minor tail protein n=1 Tax=Mycobacterium phage Typha TaxID=2517971 RepID=A0A482JAL1_9CAUD|nr:minor tail protein [Mycobacterium phage Typha]QBP29685.1 minor tail protein [Mycobacterium phage Typha]
MPWSYPPVIPELTHEPAWFPDKPEPEPPQHEPAWFPRYRFTVTDQGVGTDLALLVPDILVTDRGIGGDSALMGLPPLDLGDQGVGADLAIAGVLGADQGVGADLAGLGVYGWDQAAGSDSGLVVPKVVTGDQACGADLAALLVPQSGRDQGVGSDSGTAGFAPHAALAATYTTVGAYTFTIPVWCRYIDVILLGGGGGGKGMATAGFWGQGGRAGVWTSVTLERGVHIPWTAIQITGTVGAGGTPGQGSFLSAGNGGPGGATTASAAGWAGASAAGGAGGTAQNFTDNSGLSPGNRTHNGVTYTGGSLALIGNGNAPGGGGAGAQVSTGNGGAGARGQAWFYCYQ